MARLICNAQPMPVDRRGAASFHKPLACCRGSVCVGGNPAYTGTAATASPWTIRTHSLGVEEENIRTHEAGDLLTMTR